MAQFSGTTLGKKDYEDAITEIRREVLTAKDGRIYGLTSDNQIHDLNPQLMSAALLEQFKMVIAEVCKDQGNGKKIVLNVPSKRVYASSNTPDSTQLKVKTAS